ncbi:MAG TPA: S41 family peptidase [Spirochaetota bacterium]|nr:S41 family peptidase [Spirochaetota bacterium]HOL57836.1 S41 family peptidase [Spirochaetota bacterium]HPP05414.1 S41 family peptidase [Spirochaetota bacterium]
MKSKERFIWILIVFVLLIASLLGIFTKNVFAGSISSDFPSMQKFITVLNRIKTDYVDESKIDEKKLINGAIKGMLDALEDPHTTYLSEKDMEDMQDTTTGSFGGVGMIIQEKDDYIVVVTPIEDTPAYRKGMKPGDLLISVDGKSLKGVKVSEAAKMLRGTPGTTVKVEFIRNDMKYEVEFVRAKIDVPTVKYDIINNKYGYLRITQFTGTTDSHVKKALEEFNSKKKIEAIIIDLRFNPGGLLSQAIKIADMFQDEGVIVSTKGRNYQNEVWKASKFDTLLSNDVKIVVLVDGGSASASEIFAGAIKDHNRGILVGEKTFGKGSVQTIVPLGKDGFKITIAKYYTPADISIEGVGIQPDVEVKDITLTDEELVFFKKLLKDKIVENYIKKNSNPTKLEIESYAKEIIQKGYLINIDYLKRYIKKEAEFDDEKRPVYDLEYDIQLQKCVDILDKNLIEYRDGKYYLKK